MNGSNMKNGMKSVVEENRLVILLGEKIDSSNAAETEQQIRLAMEANPELPCFLDARNTKYISSAGLRILLSLQKKAQNRITVCEVSAEVYDVFSMTGLTEILKVQRRMRSISVEGCPVIGSGAVGTVYRLDEDTIVKVYNQPDSLPMIEQEQKRAKQALIRGIPTAISYDVVRVGEKYGSVFELVKADTCNHVIVQDPARTDEIIGLYVALMKTVHAVRMPAGELPDARAVYAGYLKDLTGMLPDDLIARIGKLLGEMPEDLHAVHGDIQMKNVMLSEDEPMLIDMETLCVGNPVFEFAGLWVTYCAFNEDDPGNAMAFLGIDTQTCEAIYRKVLSLYIGDGQRMREAADRIRVVGALRFLYILTVMRLGASELMEIRVRHTREMLEKLLETVDTLVL